MNAEPKTSIHELPNRAGNVPSRAQSDREERISEAIGELLVANEAGTADRSALLSKYKDVVDELAGCLDAFDFMNAVAPHLGASPDAVKTRGETIQPLATLGDFRILREIGRGGMGVVYEAEQLSLGRLVALKVLPFAAMLDKQQLARFKNEARAAATLDHPNIVAIYSVGVERSVHFYAMQLIEGQSLAEVITALRRGSREQGAGSREEPTIEHYSSNVAPQSAIRNPKSAIAESAIDTSPAAHLSTLPDFSSREYYRSIARLGIQAAEALDHAHQNGILHRDIKPANLLVDDAGKLWITDFGLARIEQDAGVTMTGDLLGTLRYMSPEQALAKRVIVDHRSDIYSLGVTLYELLTLQPAYAAVDRQELLRQIAFEEPLKPRKCNARIPQDLETIVLKATEKNPVDRYTTAQGLADDLRAFLDHLPVKAQLPTAWQRTVKWSRRHRPIVASAGASLAALVAISMGVLIYSNAVIKRERNDKSAALDREIQVRRELEASAKYARLLPLINSSDLEAAERLFDEIPTELLPIGTDEVALRIKIASLYSWHEEWPQAAANYEKALTDRISKLPIYEHGLRQVFAAPVLVESGNSGRYKKFQHDSMSRFLNTTNPIIAERICRSVLLRPADAVLMAKLDGLYQLLLRGQVDGELMQTARLEIGETTVIAPDRNKIFKDFGALALALVEYRRGNYAKAIEWRKQYPERPLTTRGVVGATTAGQAIVAMAYHQLHRDAEAKTALALAHVFHESPEVGYSAGNLTTLAGVDRQYAEVVLREADALVNGGPPQFDRGLAAIQNMLGFLYANTGFFSNKIAKSVPEDTRETPRQLEAIKWFCKAADQGFAVAELNLGYEYSIGRGVAQDHAEAARWYLKATDKFSWTCSISPNAADLLIAPFKAAESVIIKRQPNAGNLATLGAVYYRLQRYQDARQRLEESIAAFATENSSSSTVLYPQLQLAMTKWQLGEQKEARQLLAETKPAVEEFLNSDSTDWNHRATLILLRREAEQLIGLNEDKAQ